MSKLGIFRNLLFSAPATTKICRGVHLGLSTGEPSLDLTPDKKGSPLHFIYKNNVDKRRGVPLPVPIYSEHARNI